MEQFESAWVTGWPTHLHETRRMCTNPTYIVGHGWLEVWSLLLWTSVMPPAFVNWWQLGEVRYTTWFVSIWQRTCLSVL